MSKENQIEIRQKNFLAKWTNSSKSLVKVKTINDVFLIKTPALSEINKECGNEFMINYLSIWISKINSFAGGNMTSEDCKDSASFIYEDFYFLTIADLKVIAKIIRSRTFIRVTGNEIYREIESYFSKRCELASDMSRQKAEDHKKEFGNERIFDSLARAKSIGKANKKL